VRPGADFEQHCRVLDVSLRRRDYLAGRLSVAHFALAYFLFAAAPVGLELDSFPAAAAWLARMHARRSVTDALDDARLSMQRMVTNNADAEYLDT
jgi:glutathione S-transferase